MYLTRLAQFIAVFAIFSFALVNLSHAQSFGTSPVPSGPADIVITNFSIPGTIGINAPLNILLQLQNNGGLATGNITININIARLNTSLNLTYNVSALSPYQSESVVIHIYNKTGTPGQHNVTVYASYKSNGALQYSGAVQGSYDIVSTQSPPNKNAVSLLQIPDLTITYIPTYTALYSGNEQVSEMGVKNTGTVPEFVNVSIPKNYSNLITLSTSSVYLSPNSQLYIQFVLRANATMTDIATYSIPFNFTVSPVGGTQNTVNEKISLTVSNQTQSQPSILNQVTLINSTNSTTGIIEVRSGTAESINNATLVTYLPYGAVNDASSIMTSGLQANVVQVGGKYQINWFIPYLPAGQVQYAYYQISKLEGSEFSFKVGSVLTIPSILRPLSLLKIVNFSLPTFYTNSTEKMSVDVLYTGTSGQSVYFYLTAPPSVTIYNSTQLVNATPNQLLVRNFIVKTGGTPGTLIFTLYINTQNTNVSYSLPIVVLQNGQPTGSGSSSSTSTIKAVVGGTTKPISINIKGYIAYIVAAVAILLIVLLIYGVMVVLNRPNYNRQRLKKLMDVKNQIKRQGGNVG